MKKYMNLINPKKSRIEEARNEYKNAQILTEEDANNEIDQWLNEKEIIIQSVWDGRRDTK